MPTAAIYARISHDSAGEQLGVDRQERLCRQLAVDRDLTVTDVLVDNDVSAYRRTKRPAFERLVELLSSGAVDSVVAYHADRLYRRTADLERLVDIVESHAAQVYTVAAGNIDLTTASGRMVARIIGATAQHESERMGERLKAKGDELAAKGSPPGGRPPFGYRWEDVADEATGRHRPWYTINPREADAVRLMARRVLEGASLLGLSRELDAAGVATREGRPWHHSAVRRVLVNPAIAGLRVQRREVAGPGRWEPILERATWEEVRAVIADPARKRTRPARSNLLAGLVRNEAGDRMNGRDDRAAGGRLTRRYATRWPAVPSLSIGADELEELIVEAVLLRLDDVELPGPDASDGAGAEVVAIEAEIVELARQRGEGLITLAEWSAFREPAQRRLETARTAAAGSARRSSQVESLLRNRGAARRAWPELAPVRRREVIGTLVDRVVIKPAGRGRWTPIDERVDVTWKA